MASFDKPPQRDVCTTATEGIHVVVTCNLIIEVLSNDSKAAVRIQYFRGELIHRLRVGYDRLLRVYLCHTRRPAGTQGKLLVVQLFIRVVSGSLDAAADTHMQYLAWLDEGVIHQSSHAANSLVASYIRGLFHGISLHHYACRGQQLVIGMLKHQSEHTIVVEYGVALRLFHGLLER